MTKKHQAHPIIKLEKKVLTSLKNYSTYKLLEKIPFKFLREQDASENIPTFQEILNGINFSVIKLPGEPWEVKYNYQKSKGATKIFLHNKFVPSKPTLVFHHGLGTLNFLEPRIFANGTILNNFNFFSIKASHHNNPNDIRRNCTNKFINLALTVASSVIAVDEVANFNRNNSIGKMVVVGDSLGGMITSLHHFFFDTADLYFPITSYPNLGEIILSKNVSSVIANYEKLKKNNSIKTCFNIPTELKKKDKSKVTPILARHDEIIDFNRAVKFWSGYNYKIYNVGHYSIVLRAEKIREMIITTVNSAK